MPTRSILIVDDEPTVADLVGMVLEPRGMRVVPAHDGAEALQAAEREPFDVIILDVMMPALDGLEVCRRLRQGLGQKDARIILCSAAEESSVGWREAGADAFLAKPFRIAALSRLIERLLAKAEAPGIRH